MNIKRNNLSNTDNLKCTIHCLDVLYKFPPISSVYKLSFCCGVFSDAGIQNEELREEECEKWWPY